MRERARGARVLRLIKTGDQGEVTKTDSVLCSPVPHQLTTELFNNLSACIASKLSSNLTRRDLVNKRSYRLRAHTGCQNRTQRKSTQHTDTDTATGSDILFSFPANLRSELRPQHTSAGREQYSSADHSPAVDKHQQLLGNRRPQSFDGRLINSPKVQRLASVTGSNPLINEKLLRCSLSV